MWKILKWFIRWCFKSLYPFRSISEIIDILKHGDNIFFHLPWLLHLTVFIYIYLKSVAKNKHNRSLQNTHTCIITKWTRYELFWLCRICLTHAFAITYQKDLLDFVLKVKFPLWISDKDCVTEVAGMQNAKSKVYTLHWIQ